MANSSEFFAPEVLETSANNAETTAKTNVNANGNAKGRKSKRQQPQAQPQQEVNPFLAKFGGYAQEQAQLSQSYGDLPEWFVPTEREQVIETCFVEVDDMNQILFEHLIEETLIRVPNSIASIMNGKMTARASYYNVLRTVNSLRNVASHYGQAYYHAFQGVIKKHMVLDNAKEDSIGTIFDEKEKDTYGNEIMVTKVWTASNRKVVQGLVDAFTELLANWEEDHPEITMTVSPRSRIGSAIIENVAKA